MKIGDVVFNDYHGIRRYGVVETKKVNSDGWAYCQVEWINDRQYEQAMSDRSELTGGRDWTLKEYRVDQLKVIDLHKELRTLEDIRHLLNRRVA